MKTHCKHTQSGARPANPPAAPKKPTWKEVFAALDAAQLPADFLEHRDQGTPEVRERLDPRFPR